MAAENNAFDARAPFAKLFVDASALAEFGQAVAFDDGEGHVFDAVFRCESRVGLAGKTAVCGHGVRNICELPPATFEDGAELCAIAGIAFFDRAVEDEVAFEWRDRLLSGAVRADGAILPRSSDLDLSCRCKARPARDGSPRICSRSRRRGLSVLETMRLRAGSRRL